MSTKTALIEELDIEFAPGLLIDIVRPVADGPLPVIVWLHGGAWRAGDRTWRPDFAGHFAASGYVMASVDYTLSGDGVFPRPLEDVIAAITWLRSHAEEHGIDPDAIGLWGSSAGGHLAALAGMRAGVQAVMDGYGAADLTTPDQDNPPTAGLLGGAPADRVGLARAASPALQEIVDAPPFLIMHGAADPLVPATQSIALYDALAAAGADATLYLIAGFGHGFLNLAGVDEVAGPPLDSGRLEAEPTASAEVRSTRGTAVAEHASFELIERFFADTLARR